MIGPIEPQQPGCPDESTVSRESLSPEQKRTDDVREKILSRSLSLIAAGGVSCLESRVSYAGVSELDLDHLALPSGEGLGYKTANLRLLQLIAKTVGAEVPPFIGLSHHELLAHILTHYPGFKDDYASFVASLPNPPVLTEEGLSLLTKIQAELKRAFSNSLPLFESVELKKWLESVGSEFIAVRSTGKEDSTTNSNAGGNLSNPFVENSRDEILKNIGDVIASYFDKKSITQRISSDDSSLVEDKEPFVPVLLQWAIAEPMSGETPDHQVPRSGVMFVKSGVSEVSVGLGHNEGIVTSQVRTDCYRFTSSGGIEQVIQNKSTRFRGKKDEEVGVRCVAVACSKALAETPALKPEIAKKLQHIANELYKLKKMEMDVEFTIVGDKIYLLQARPLNTPKPIEEPSYLQESVEKIQCESLTDGGSFVRKIESTENVIVCKTIQEAYEKYKKVTDRNQIKGIILEESAPRTSHEAVFFTGRGLPILVKKGGIELKPTYYLDPQQGIISQTGSVEKGYICYPMPLQRSMQSSELVEMMDRCVYEKSFSLKSKIQEKLAILSARIGTQLGPEVTNIAGLKRCLEVVKRGTSEDVKIALSQIVRCVAKQGVASDIPTKTGIELIMVLENLLNVINDQSFDNLPMSLERLYTARLIEACLFQTGEGIIGGFSYLRSLTDIKNQRVGIKELNRPYTEETLKDILFIKMGRQILQKEMKSNWEKVVSDLHKLSETNKDQLKTLFQTVDSMGGGTQFVNVTLLRLLKEHADNPIIFFEKTRELAATLEPILEKALEIHKFSEDLKAQRGTFSGSEQIKKALPRLKEKLKEIGFTLSDDSIANTFDAVSPDARLILISAIREFVTVFDQTIKACTGSTYYASHVEQAKDFLALLHPYKELMQVVGVMCGKPEWYHVSSDSYYLPESLETVSEMDAELLKEVSSDFNVSQLINGAVYTITCPKDAISLEEKFTLFHQTMEKSLSQLAIMNGFTIGIFPKELTDIISKLSSGRYFKEKILTDIGIEGDQITSQFSIALNQHAANLQLIYDRIDGGVRVKLKIDGGNEGNRWPSLKIVGEKLRDYLNIDLEIKVNHCGCEIDFKKIPLEGEIGFEEVGEMLERLILRSFDVNTDVISVVPAKLQTEALFEEYFSNKYLNLSFVAERFLTDAVLESALEKSVWNYAKVPKSLMKERHILKAVSKENQILECVPDELKTESVVKAALKKNHHAFRYIPTKMQTIEMCLNAVRENGKRIEFVDRKFLTKEVINAALGQSLDAFEKLPKELQTLPSVLDVVSKIRLLMKFPQTDQNRELVLTILQIRGDLLRYVRSDLITPEVLYVALQQNIEAFTVVPKDMQTEELALMAVSKNYKLLKYVRADLHTEEVLFSARSQDPDLFSEIPQERQTLEMALKVVSLKGELLEFIRSDLQTDEVINAALIQDPFALIHVNQDRQTEEMVFNLVQVEPRVIHYVAERLRTKDLVMLAFQKEVGAFMYISHDDQTQEMVNAAVKEDWRLLRYVNQKFITPEVKEWALKQNTSAARFFPKDL